MQVNSSINGFLDPENVIDTKKISLSGLKLEILPIIEGSVCG